MEKLLATKSAKIAVYFCRGFLGRICFPIWRSSLGRFLLQCFCPQDQRLY